MAAAATLSAAAVSFTRTSGFTYVDAVAELFDSGEVHGPSSGKAGPSPNGVGLQFQTAYTEGSADFGTLRALATGYSSHALLLPQARTNAEWRDTIHISSPVLPNGAPATIFFALQLTALVTTIPNGPVVIGSNAWAYLDGLGAINDLFVYDAFGIPLAALASGTYNTTVGSDLLIGADLQVNIGPQDAYAAADAKNTGLFAMKILTPDVYYTSASGTVFASSFQPVPEPGTFVLVGIALGLALHRRRSRKA